MKFETCRPTLSVPWRSTQARHRALGVWGIYRRTIAADCRSTAAHKKWRSLLKFCRSPRQCAAMPNLWGLPRDCRTWPRNARYLPNHSIHEGEVAGAIRPASTIASRGLAEMQRVRFPSDSTLTARAEIMAYGHPAPPPGMARISGWMRTQPVPTKFFSWKFGHVCFPAQSRHDLSRESAFAVAVGPKADMPFRNAHARDPKRHGAEDSFS